MIFRIILTAYDFPPRLGGIATCAHEVSQALARRKNEVELVVLARYTRGSETFDRSCGLNIHRFRPLGTGSLASIPPLARAIRSELGKRPVDVILNLNWMPEAAATRGALWGIRARPAWFCWAHAMEIIESDKTLKKKIRGHASFVKKWLFRELTGVFAVSRFTKRLVLQRTGIQEENVSVVWNGVDTAKYVPNPRTQTDILELISVCRLEPFKGVDQVLESLGRLDQQHPELAWHYRIVGEGPDRARLEQLTRSSGLAKRVTFLGAISEADKISAYQNSDIHLLCSREDWDAPNIEGFGVVFLEAAACGLPSIGGNSGGIPDAIEDQKTGLLVPPEDPKAIMEALLFLARNPKIRLEMGKNARERCENSFRWDDVAERILHRMKQSRKGSA